MLQKNEVLDRLRDDCYIIQKKEGFKYGVDAVLLASFIKTNPKDMVVDFGSGSGILPLLLQSKTVNNRFLGVEIQKEYVDMANRSVRLNALRNIRFIEGDFTKTQELIIKGSVDHVISNPPYFLTKEKSPNVKKQIARHEVAMNLQALVENSAYVLRDYGNLWMIYLSERLFELAGVLKENQLELKELRFIHSTPEKKSKLVLLRATKRARKGLYVHPPLIIYNDKQQYTQEILALYDESGIDR